MARQDHKRHDGLTRIPSEGSRSLTWDVTVVYSMAGAAGLGAVGELAAVSTAFSQSRLKLSVPSMSQLVPS